MLFITLWKEAPTFDFTHGLCRKEELFTSVTHYESLTESDRWNEMYRAVQYLLVFEFLVFLLFQRLIYI